MKLYTYIVLLGGMLLALPTLAMAQINVFACEPEWASLAKEIGGDDVKAFSATNAKQDPHHIRARPSLIAKMRKADLLVCSGADLEIGWLPILLQKAGNSSVQLGQVGSLMAANHVPLLEVPQVVDRINGDVHPQGNPHIQLNPHNISAVAQVLAQRLMAIDPEHATAYQKRLADFNTRWHTAMQKWEVEAKPLAGKGYVPHHRNWSYLADWLGMKEIAALEPKPGIPPTSKHLEKVLKTVAFNRPAFIVRSPYANAQGATWLADKTKLPSLVLPYTVGGDAQSTDLFHLFDRTLTLLLDALHG